MLEWQSRPINAISQCSIEEAGASLQQGNVLSLTVVEAPSSPICSSDLCRLIAGVDPRRQGRPNLGHTASQLGLGSGLTTASQTHPQSPFSSPPPRICILEPLLRQLASVSAKEVQREHSRTSAACSSSCCSITDVSLIPWILGCLGYPC